MAEPKRPGMRLGVEQEGRFCGAKTLVILGAVSWARISEAISRHSPAHIFWEVARDQEPPPWDTVRKMLSRPVSKGRAVTVEVEDPEDVPDTIAGKVEVMVRVSAKWAAVSTIKINHGGFKVSWTGLEPWRTTRPADYDKDVEL